MRQIILLPLFCGLYFFVIGQDQVWLRYSQPLHTPDNYFVTNGTTLGTGATDDWQEIRTHTDQIGRHIRYRQLHKGIPVVGAEYVLHTQGGYVSSANGKSAKNLQIDTRPSVSGGEVATLIAQQYESEVEVTRQRLVIINRAFPYQYDQYVLAYETDVKSSNHAVYETIYTDAHTGSEIFKHSNICQHQVPGTGQSFYYGTVDIDVDQRADGIYVLHDPTRGSEGISVFNDANDRSEYTSTTPDFDLRNDDRDEVACDLLFCTAHFYDVMVEKFDWRGLDNNNLSMNGIVHAGEGMPFLNAFWDGEFAHFGDGDCHNNPLTTMMITSHEFMHGITDYTSDLIYAEESGALNEGMSDIFGKYSQYLHDPTDFDWTADSTIVRTELGRVFRDMSNPNRMGNPAYYGGLFWQNGANASVHNNSGVVNYWFYMLSEGKSAVNEVGYAYDVPAIGIDKAALISWVCQSSYLTPSSTYQDMYNASISVVTELYGAASMEMDAVVEAWTAVGVGIDSAEPILDASIVVLSPQSTCIQDRQLYIDMAIVNTGTETIPEGEIFEVTSSDFIQDESQIIVTEQPLLPGEQITFTTEQPFMIDDELSSFNFYNIELLYSDDSDANNFNSYFNTNATSESLDISLTGVLLSEVSCATDLTTIQLRISNESCNIVRITSGLQLELYDIDDNLITTIGVLEESGQDELVLFPARASLSRFDIELPNTSAVELVQLLYEEDVKPANNATASINYEFLDINDDGLIAEDFENQFGRPAAWTGSNYSVGDFDGSKMLIASSSWAFNQGFLILCDDLEQVLDNPAFESSITETNICIDAAEYDNVRLTFDLIQFRDRNNVALVEYGDLTVFTAVKWGEGDDEEIEFIVGQEEGLKVNNEVALPDNYVGPLTIQLFSKIGGNTFPPLSGDCQMIDNIMVTGVVSTADEEIPVFTALSPNPTKGLLYIDEASAGLRYEIHAVDGASVQSGTVSDGVIDISTQQSGMYLVRLISADGDMQTSKVIKI